MQVLDTAVSDIDKLKGLHKRETKEKKKKKKS